MDRIDVCNYLYSFKGYSISFDAKNAVNAYTIIRVFRFESLINIFYKKNYNNIFLKRALEHDNSRTLFLLPLPFKTQW